MTRPQPASFRHRRRWAARIRRVEARQAETLVELAKLRRMLGKVLGFVRPAETAAAADGPPATLVGAEQTETPVAVFAEPMPAGSRVRKAAATKGSRP